MSSFVPARMRWLAAVGVASVMALHADAQWTYQLVHPPGAGLSHAESFGSGQTTGWADFNTGIIYGFVWTTSGSLTLLNSSTQPFVMTFGTDGGFQIGVADTSAGETHAGLWQGTPESYVDLNPAGAQASYGYAISGGTQVGFAWFNDVSHAGRWSGTAASWVDLHPAGAAASECAGVSQTQQVGSAQVGDNAHAALWSGSADSYIDIHPAGMTNSYAKGVHQGQQVGFADDGSATHAFLWTGTAASAVSLTPSGFLGSHAYGVYNGVQVGDVVFDDVGDFKAALWTGSAGSYVDLHAILPTGMIGSGATSVWDDGTTQYVSGYMYNSNTDYAIVWSRPLSAACDAIDFNNDGLFPDTADIDDFLAVFAGLPCPSTGSACNTDIDFNNDGLFPDTLDIDSFLSVFSGNACV